MSKYGGYGDIHNQAKNRDWQLEYKQKSKGSSSSYGKKAQIPATTLEEDWRDLKNVFDPRSEEQKAKSKELKVQTQKEKNSKKAKEYYGNIIKIDDEPIPFDIYHRKKLKDGTIGSNIYDGGTIKESVIYKQYNYKMNTNKYTVLEFRSMIFPEKLDHAEKITVVEVTPKDFTGVSIDEMKGYLKLAYDNNGNLYNIKVSHKPFFSKSNQAPVLIVVDNELCTLTVSSGHFKHLSSIVEKNGGHVEYLNDQEMPDITELTGESSDGGSCIIS